jgi:hypothetical protein
LDLRAPRDGAAVGAAAHDHPRLLAAVTDGAHFAQLVGEREERRAAWKELAKGVDAEAVCGGESRSAGLWVSSGSASSK